MFDSTELSKSIQNQLNSGQIVIPDGHRLAVITHYDTVNGAKATVAYKANNEWTVSGETDWSHDTGIKAGVNVVWSR